MRFRELKREIKDLEKKFGLLKINNNPQKEVILQWISQMQIILNQLQEKLIIKIIKINKNNLEIKENAIIGKLEVKL